MSSQHATLSTETIDALKQLVIEARRTTNMHGPSVVFAEVPAADAAVVAEILAVAQQDTHAYGGHMQIEQIMFPDTRALDDFVIAAAGDWHDIALSVSDHRDDYVTVDITLSREAVAPINIGIELNRYTF